MQTKSHSLNDHFKVFKVIILTGDSDPHYSGTPESASHRSNIVEIILVPEVKEQKKYVLKFYSYI